MFKLPLKQEKRQIIHIDADAFFASVEQILNPKLRGKAILVGWTEDNKGIVSAASYEAKKFGIYSGMPMYLARRKCPHGIVVHGHFEAYRDFSQRMYEIFCRYTPTVEMASIDEAYLDISGCELMHKMSAPEIAKSILLEGYKKLGLSLSGGLASSKLVAKVASSINKPHKLTVVPFGSEAAFLAPLDLGKIPGIGVKTLPVLEKMGFHKAGEIAEIEPEVIIQKYGLDMLPIWKKCRGFDNSLVIAEHALPKSISKEHTFYEAVEQESVAVSKLHELAEIVFEKLRSYELKAKTIFIKIRYRDRTGTGHVFRDVSFQKHLDWPLSADKELWPLILRLFRESWTGEEIRLIGVGVSGLIKNYNLTLFGESLKPDAVSNLIDKLKGIYGESGIRYGMGR